MGSRATAIRRNYPIMGYVGPNGSGKSATAVLDTMVSLRLGRPCLSTVRLLDFNDPRPCEGYRHDPLTGELLDCEICQRVSDPEGEVYAHRQAHPLWIPFREWSQLLEAKRCDALLDEVTGIASSRESMSMPSVVANKLVQMRRDDVVIRWTAPNWRRADTIIRECSQAVTYCTGHFSKRHVDLDGARAWRNRRLSRARTYDADAFEDFTAGKREQLRPWAVSMAWLPRSGVFDAYDSFDAVLTIGTVSEGGTCERCGGRRQRRQCRCEPHGAAASVSPGAPAEAAQPRGASDDRPRGRRVRTDVAALGGSGDTPSRVLAPSG